MIKFLNCPQIKLKQREIFFYIFGDDKRLQLIRFLAYINLIFKQRVSGIHYNLIQI